MGIRGIDDEDVVTGIGVAVERTVVAAELELMALLSGLLLLVPVAPKLQFTELLPRSMMLTEGKSPAALAPESAFPLLAELLPLLMLLFLADSFGI